MLTIVIPPFEKYDEESNTFTQSVKETTLHLEHSLISISKWEAIWKKPYLSKTPKTNPEIYSYIKCMTMDKNIPDDVYTGLTPSNIKAIKAYIEDTPTATTISKNGNAQGKIYGKKNTDTITAEIIYFWMTSLQIPFEPCEKWHLNRLLIFIEVCNEKSSTDQKKMSKGEVMKQNRALNAARRAKHHTKG